MHRPDYDFSLEYRKAVKRMLEDDAARVRANARDEPRAAGGRSRARIEGSLQEFQAIFSRPHSGPSPWRMSRARRCRRRCLSSSIATRPVLQQPFRLLAALMNVDELLTLWRYRHALCWSSA